MSKSTGRTGAPTDPSPVSITKLQCFHTCYSQKTFTVHHTHFSPTMSYLKNIPSPHPFLQRFLNSRHRILYPHVHSSASCSCLLFKTLTKKSLSWQQFEWLRCSNTFLTRPWDAGLSSYHCSPAYPILRKNNASIGNLIIRWKFIAAKSIFTWTLQGEHLLDTGSASTDSFSRLILISGNVELMETGTEMATGCDGGATTVVMETEIGVVVETAAVTVDKEVGWGWGVAAAMSVGIGGGGCWEFGCPDKGIGSMFWLLIASIATATGVVIETWISGLDLGLKKKRETIQIKHQNV